VEKTDEQLARGAMEGDPEAFGTLVERFRAPLVGYCSATETTPRSWLRTPFWWPGSESGASGSRLA
jgi:hypothetical protein